MAWTIIHKAPRGARVARYFRDVCVEESDLWFDHETRKWLRQSETGSMGYGSHDTNGPKTLRAFKRYLRKHPELKGHVVCLCNKYYYSKEPDINLNVLAVWSD